MAQRERIARLLASGFDPKLVARITDTPIPQLKNLLADDEFKAQVELAQLGDEAVTHQQQASKEVLSLKDALQAAEHQSLLTLHSRLETMEDRNLIAAFQAIGSRRDALTKNELAAEALKQATKGGGNGVPTVIINLPDIVIPELNLSSSREVVGIGSRTTIPMGRDRLTALIEGELSHEQLPKA